MFQNLIELLLLIKIHLHLYRLI